MEKEGKTNIKFIISALFLLIVMLLFANALTMDLGFTSFGGAPGNHTFNYSRSINFTFNVTWDLNSEIVNNCSLWTNATGSWAEAKINDTDNSGNDDLVANRTGSYMNYTFSVDGNISWSIGCIDGTGSLNFPSPNKTVFIDSLAPSVFPDTIQVASATEHNITSYATAAIYVNVSDNTTIRNGVAVWAVLNDKLSLDPSGVNETVNRTMTLETTVASDRGRYVFNLSSIFNFSSTFTGPGPHSVFFCANDSGGRITCSERVNFAIKGMNVSEMERQFADESIKGPGGGDFTFQGMDIRYGNGSDVPFSTFIDPTSGNFTFNMNFTADNGIYIVGGRIDESQFANASQTNFSDTITDNITQAVGPGFKANLTWVDIGSFIPKEVSYEFGIIQMRGKFGKKMFCNGTSVSNPNCFTIAECNSSNIGLFNHSKIIPVGSACWLESGQWGEEPVTLASGFTYLFVDHFSGGLGGNDRSEPNVTFNLPRVDITNFSINRSTTVTQLINFTVDDLDSTGINLTKNGTINLTITLSGGVQAFFNYTGTNGSFSRLSCNTADTTSKENTTSVICNATFAFNSNGTYTINVTGSDTGNNSNKMNVTTSFFTLTVDQIPPVVSYFNITNASKYNASNGGNSEAIELGLGAGISRAQGDANTGIIYVAANWTENLTQPFQAAFQFYNGSAQAWQTLNTTNVTPFANGGWSNTSFPIPTGHNNFEGQNISFRIVANDTLGNVNTSDVKNITVQINDTTKPTITINGTLSVNGTAISDTTPRISWVVDEGSHLTSINVSIDRTLPAVGGGVDGCGRSAHYDVSVGADNVEKKRNFSFQVEPATTDPSCPLANGSHIVEVTAIDGWGNQEVVSHNFTIQAGTTPTIVLTALQNGLSAVNQSNVTPYTGINFTVSNGIAGVKNMSWTSSCNDTVQFINNSQPINDSFIWPFNYTGCKNREANQTLNITAYDNASNKQTAYYQFLVDDLAPTLTVTTPTNGFSGVNEIYLNISAKDGTQRISMFGYYLDDRSLVLLNHSVGLGDAAVNVSISNTTNFTAGTHTIKFTASDAAGGIANNVFNNTVNSSRIKFTVVGPVVFGDVNGSMSSYTNQFLGNNLTNISIRIKSGAGSYNTISTANDTNNTYEIVFEVNGTVSGTAGGINISLTELNGSAANWDKINFTPQYLNGTILQGVQNNYTNTVLKAVVFNNSIEEFISNNNSYYGVVVMPYNISANASGNLGTAQEFWWIKDEGTLTTRENISQCGTASGGAASFSTTRVSPCWNYTSGGRTIIQVPHFSIVVAVNDSTAPTITVNTPSSTLGNHTVSAFEPNITVSSDTDSCKYVINTTGATANQTMVKTVKTDTVECIGATERFKTLNDIYNITFYATDSAGNVATLQFDLNISDTAAPGTSGAVTSSPGTTSATVSVGANESVNVTISYDTTNTTMASKAHETDFNTSQTVTISSLTASTKYYFNVSVCDFNGNCLSNGTFTFTTSAAAAAASTEGGSSGTGTGGGGGAAVVTNVQASKAQVWANIPSGASASLNVDSADIAVTKVSISVNKDANNVEIKVSSLKDKPVTADAAAAVYQYLQITKKNLQDSQADKVTIGFRVPKSWLTENNLQSADVSLYRYKDNEWTMLTTRVVSSDANNVNYEADTPGLSYFAIGSGAAPAVPEEAPEEVPTEEAPPEEAPPTPVEAPKPIEAPSKAPAGWIILAIVIVIGIIGYFVYQRQKKGA